MIEKLAQIVIPTTPVPGQQGFTLAELGSLIAIFGSFLQSAGAVLALIAIVAAGIKYMMAGSSPESIGKARTWFKNGLIGALIILGSGVILNTIANVVSREFFCRLIIFGRCVIQ